MYHKHQLCIHFSLFELFDFRDLAARNVLVHEDGTAKVTAIIILRHYLTYLLQFTQTAQSDYKYMF